MTRAKALNLTLFGLIAVTTGARFVLGVSPSGDVLDDWFIPDVSIPDIGGLSWGVVGVFATIVGVMGLIGQVWPELGAAVADLEVPAFFALLAPPIMTAVLVTGSLLTGSDPNVLTLAARDALFAAVIYTEMVRREPIADVD